MSENKTTKPNHCQSCGMMIEDPAEYHTFAYCAAFKVILNGTSVRENMEYTVKNHPFVKALTTQLAAALKERERLEAMILPVLTFYGGEAAAIAKNFQTKDDFKLHPIMASLTILSLDGGNRAEAVKAYLDAQEAPPEG